MCGRCYACGLLTTCPHREPFCPISPRRHGPAEGNSFYTRSCLIGNVTADRTNKKHTGCSRSARQQMRHHRATGWETTACGYLTDVCTYRQIIPAGLITLHYYARGGDTILLRIITHGGFRARLRLTRLWGCNEAVNKSQQLHRRQRANEYSGKLCGGFHRLKQCFLDECEWASIKQIVKCNVILWMCTWRGIMPQDGVLSHIFSSWEGFSLVDHFWRKKKNDKPGKVCSQTCKSLFLCAFNLCQFPFILKVDR